MVSGLVLVRAEVAERAVHAQQVIQGLDVVDDAEPSDVAVGEDVLLDELELDRPYRRLVGGVVVSAARKGVDSAVVNRCLALPFWLQASMLPAPPIEAVPLRTTEQRRNSPVDLLDYSNVGRSRSDAERWAWLDQVDVGGMPEGVFCSIPVQNTAHGIVRTEGASTRALIPAGERARKPPTRMDDDRGGCECTSPRPRLGPHCSASGRLSAGLGGTAGPSLTDSRGAREKSWPGHRQLPIASNP